MTDYKKSKLPFNIVSSSANTGYITEISSGFKSGVDIVGHHQDTYAGLENEPLQSPFTKEHVGGNQHRHVPLNSGNDNDFNRPEAFKIKPESGNLKIYGPDFESVNKPRAQMWRGAKSPINISNIQISGNIGGNFDKNYQVVQTVGRRITNNLIVDGFIASGNLTTQFIKIPEIYVSAYLESSKVTGSLAVDTNDFFGFSVSLNSQGNIFAVGAYDDESGSNGDGSGVVYIFQNGSSGCVEVARLTGSLAVDTNDLFGISVSLNSQGNILAVGAYRDESGSNGASSGVAYIFESGSSGYVEVARLTGSLAVDTNDFFGISVSLNSQGNILAVGAYRDESGSNGASSGVAYIFESGSSGYVEVAKLTGSLAIDASDNFGISVSLNSQGNILAVGTWGDESGSNGASSGVAYIFESGSSGYVEVAKLTGSLAIDESDFFGFSVSLNSQGNILAVGAYQDESGSNGDSSGVAYIFESGSSGYAEVAKLTGSLAIDASDNFGISVSLNSQGNILAVGTWGDESGSNGDSSGVAYIFESGSSGYVEVAKLTGSLAIDASDFFGFSVSLNSQGNILAVGAYQDESGSNGDSSGVAYIFEQPKFIKLSTTSYLLPNLIVNTKTTFVERFNAPGGKEESSRGSLDRAGEELSPNNSLTTRNIKVRQPFYSQLTQHSAQFGSGSEEGISIHKVNRNGLRRMELSGSSEDEYISSSLYDNFWVQHAIPQDNFGYAWITASSISNPYTIGTASLEYDFSGSFEGIKDKQINLETQTIQGSLSGSDNYYSTWKQIRTSEHPVARKLKQNNIIAIEDQSLGNNSLQINSINISKRNGTSTNFREPLITNKNYPLKQELRFAGEPNTTSTKLKYTFKNNSSRFANEDLDIRLGLSDKQVEFYTKLVKANKLEVNSPINDILSINFKETLYPKELNTFLSEVRNRNSYILDQSGTGSDGYDLQLGTQRTIWRDEQENRRRTSNSSGGHINSLGYVSSLQSGSSFSVNEDSNLADENVVTYTSSFETSTGLDTNFFNSVSVLENSCSQVLAYTSKQLATFGGKTIFNRKQSNINYIAGELNEQFVDSYGTSGSADGLLKNSFGSIYRKTYYKSVTQQPPYESGSVDDQIDSVVLIPTEDNEIQINPKPRYLAFLGGVQIIQNTDTLSDFNDPDKNIFEQSEENSISSNNIVYSTIDNGLLRKTEEISGKKPFFDSYEEFITDARTMGQDYSIIPEFRISEHMKYYVSSSGGNFRSKNNAIFEIDGNGISNRSALTEKSNFNVDFKNKYLDGDELENNQIIEKDYSEDVKQNSVSLTLKGIKKLLPYNGFYPQDRTLQLANLYSEYAESNLVGGLYNVSYEENTRDEKLFSHIETTASLNSVSSLSSLKFSSSLNGECFYIAVGHHNYDSNRGSVKVFRSTTDSPFNDWNQESVVQYEGATTDCFFGQSVLLTSASNGLNLFVTEFGQNRTGSVYQMTSSNGTDWTSKAKINNLTGSLGAYFGNYLDGFNDSTKNVLAITETGTPISFENGSVYASHLSGTDLYLGGNFKSVNGDSNIKYLVKIKTTDYSITRIQGITNSVFALTASNEKLYVGGAFEKVSNSGVNRTKSRGIAVYNMNTDTWEDAKLGDITSGRSIRTIHLSGTDVYLGGTFTDYTGSSGSPLAAKRIIKINNSTFGSPTFSLLGTDSSNGTNNFVYAIQSSGSDLYVGGLFTTAYDSVNTTGKTVNYIARWNQTDNRWYPLDSLEGGYVTGTYINNPVASDLLNPDKYANSIALSNDGLKMAVGAPNAYNIFDGDGKVYIYSRNSISNNFSLVQTIVPIAFRNEPNFGHSVSFSGDANYLLVGQPYINKSSATFSGHALLFETASAGYTLRTTITASIPQMRKFGEFVVISKDKKYAVVCGTSGSSGSVKDGHASIYSLDTTGGTIKKLEEIYESPNVNIEFGTNAAINSDSNYQVVFGTPKRSSSKGAIYIAASSSAGGWSSLIQITQSNPANNDLFGFSVAMNQSENAKRILVGAPGKNMAYIYNSGSGGWSLANAITGSNFGASGFGYNVSIAGVNPINGDDLKYIAVTGISSSNNLGIKTGAVYVFYSGSYITDPYIDSLKYSDKLSGDQFSTIATSDAYFGKSLQFSGDGNCLLIGIPNEIEPNNVVGKVVEYQANSFGWINITGGLNSNVRTVIKSGSDIYVGGDFTTTKNIGSGSDGSGIKTLNRVTKFVPSSNSFAKLGDGHNNKIFKLILSSSYILAAGEFTTTGSRLSKWDGSSWSPLADGINNNQIFTLAFSSSGDYFAGGNFTSPSRGLGIYKSSSSAWLSSVGSVHVVTASIASPTNWSNKITVISGSNLAKYCSAVSASSGYHIYATDQSDNRGSIRVVSSSNSGETWSSGTLGNGLIIRSGSNSTAELGNLPIDATVFTPSGGQERVYIFTADKGTSESGSFYVFSSSINSNWNGVSAITTNNLKVIKTGSSSEPIILNSSQYLTNKTNINISSLTASNVLYYAFGTPNINQQISNIYIGRSYNGNTFEADNKLFVSSPSEKTINYGENIDISNISNAIPVFFANDYTNIFSLVKGKFVIYRLNVEGKEQYVKHASLEPVFAPGILYNTIKSGIAVDWPCTTGSNVIVKSSGLYGLRSAFYPKNLTMKTIDTEEGILNAQGALKSNINYRIPFENIIFPNELFEPKEEIKTNQYTLKPIDAPDISSTDVVNQYLNKSYIYSGYEPYIDPLEVTDLANLGPKRYSSPFVYRKLQTSDSGLYTLSVSNFLAETIKFFLRDEKLITFSSLADNKWKEFKSGTTYYMDVVLEKSPELVMMEAYSSSQELEPRNNQTFNGRYFGYPTNKTIKNVWTGSSFTLDESSQIHSDPAYAPYTPPYFEGLAKARIAFTPSTTRTYKLEEILNNAVITNIFPGIENLAATASDAYVNKMPINSSVDLKGSAQAVNVTIRNDASGQEVSEDPNNKIWVISPKMETPVLDFSSQEFEQFENSYIKNTGYGRGMWSGYGQIPNSNKGIRLRLEYPFARIQSQNTASLLEQVGFLAEEKNIGKIAENKTISEAIVVVPYLEKETNRTIKNKTSFRQSNIHFIKINKDTFNKQKKEVESATNEINSITDMIQKMKNYVIPPEMNFLEYPDLQPHVMYLFEFNHTLDQEDLSDIWQGLMPKISLNAEKDEITINHKFSKNELFGEEGMPAELKFLVFKVKKKAEYNYFNVTATTKDDNRFQFNKIIGRKQGADIYSYNWPYDFFSLVELAKVDIEVNYKKKDE